MTTRVLKIILLILTVACIGWGPATIYVKPAAGLSDYCSGSATPTHADHLCEDLEGTNDPSPDNATGCSDSLQIAWTLTEGGTVECVTPESGFLCSGVQKVWQFTSNDQDTYVDTSFTDDATVDVLICYNIISEAVGTTSQTDLWWIEMEDDGDTIDRWQEAFVFKTDGSIDIGCGRYTSGAMSYSGCSYDANLQTGTWYCQRIDWDGSGGTVTSTIKCADSNGCNSQYASETQLYSASIDNVEVDNWEHGLSNDGSAQGEVVLQVWVSAVDSGSQVPYCTEMQ